MNAGDRLHGVISLGARSKDPETAWRCGELLRGFYDVRPSLSDRYPRFDRLPGGGKAYREVAAWAGGLPRGGGDHETRMREATWRYVKALRDEGVPRGEIVQMLDDAVRQEWSGDYR